jgi:hypothetical protein
MFFGFSFPIPEAEAGVPRVWWLTVPVLYSEGLGLGVVVYFHIQVQRFTGALTVLL